MAVQRRVGLRLQNIPDNKRSYYGDDRKRLLHSPKDKVCKKKCKKKTNTDNSEQDCPHKVARESVEENGCKTDLAVQRRGSLRLQNIPDDKRPYYGDARKRLLEQDCPPKVASESVEENGCKTDLAGQRRGSQRFQIIPDDKRPYYGDACKRLFEQDCPPKVARESVEENGCKTDLAVQRRGSPRLQNIPDEKRPYYGDARKRLLEQDCPPKVARESVEENGCKTDLAVQRRGSPRLQNIPDDKRPYYGDARKRLLEQDCPPKVARESVEENGFKIDLVRRRVSPRLQSIPDDKRSYYGDDQKWLLRSSKDKVCKKKTNTDNMEQDCPPKVVRESVEERGCKIDLAVQRRGSLRLQNIRDAKRPYYGDARKRLLDSSKDNVCKKKSKTDNSEQDCPPKVARESAEENGCKTDLVSGSTHTTNGETKVVDLQNNDLSIAHSPRKSTFARVKETLRLFNMHHLHFVQEEEKRCKVEISDTQTANDRKTNMLKRNEVLYRERQIGDLAGINVGHQFYSRAEMVALGFHGHWLNGIDFMGTSYGKLKKYHGYTFPLAVSIVMPGQYEDDTHQTEEIVYTGQGRNGLLSNKLQVKDQVLHGGNLALKNNIEQNIPVRVIRGYGCHKSHKVYTYDGLYEVINYWPEKGVSGFTFFKFCLKRRKGQPKLTNHNKVSFVCEQVSKAPFELPGLAFKDISNGQEDVHIPATNLYDDPPVAPEDSQTVGFKYIKSIQVTDNVKIPPDAPGCNCIGNCTNLRSCSCAQLNGGDFAYVHSDGGRLIEARDVVFECGPRCGCGPSCVNRTSQRGLKYRLEVYRTQNKGWGVRTWDFIPSGAPLCEYVGVLRKNNELDSVSENDYILEIDCWHTMHEIGGRERRLGDVAVPASNIVEKIDKRIPESEPEPEFCIDAGSFGNVTRFINHSCEPNLFVQCVLSSHHDVRLARVVLFAADSIPPMQELTYDYGYALDSVIGPNGKIKTLPCHCGTAECRKRLY